MIDKLIVVFGTAIIALQVLNLVLVVYVMKDISDLEATGEVARKPEEGGEVASRTVWIGEEI